MKKLLSYEFYKIWRRYHIGFAAAVALQVILIPIMGIFNRLKTGEVPVVIVGSIYFVILMIILLFPLVDGIARFRHDIFGRTAVLEFSFPLPAWKKVLSKLITTFCTLLAALLLCCISVTSLWALTDGSKFKKDVSLFFRAISAHSSQAATVTAFIALNCVAAFCIIIFSLVFARSITSRLKTAGWISAAVFVAVLTAYIIFHVQIYINFGVIITVLYLIAVSVILFLGASWLLENKVEV